MNPRADHIDFHELILVDLVRATRKVQRALVREVLVPEDLSVQDWRMILHLYKVGPCHLRELARLSDLDPSPLGKAVGRMELRGYITRQADPSDARRMVLDITPEGAATVERIWPRVCAISDEVREILGKDTYDAMQMALRQLRMSAMEGEKEEALTAP